MKYMLLVYSSEESWSEAELEKCYRESARLAQQLSASGHYLAASPLQPTSTATRVRVRDGKRAVTDGPFPETREQLGGYYLIDAADLDEAIGIAERIPVASRGTIEIRPVVEISGLPVTSNHPVVKSSPLEIRPVADSTEPIRDREGRRSRAERK